MLRSSTRLIQVACLLVLGACAQSPTTPGQSTDPVQKTTESAQIAADAGADAANDPSAQTDHTGQPSADSDASSSRPGEQAPSTDTGGGDVRKPAQTWKGMHVGTNFWFLGSGWAEDAWKSGVDFATSSDPWNPVFIGDLEEADYAVYRFMDFAGTNNSTIRNWSERTQQTSADNASGGGVGGRGIAYEWMFDLCNRQQKDCWITVPHLAIESYEQNADDNYFTALAKLAKETLDPGLTLYLEYSNETWNPGFQQASYGQQRGTAMGFASDTYGASFKFHVYASSRLYDAFVKVFGNEIGRVKWVVSGQLGSDYGTTMAVDALKDAKINFGQRTPDYYAISNYVGADGSVDGASADVANQFKKALANTLAQATSQNKLIAGTGMKLISYEGGQHITNNADAFSRNQVAYELYTEWLDQMASLFALTTHYANSGTYVSGGAWGAKEKTGQALSEAPKARALVDWIKSHP